jgi:hypothetical protein
MKTKIFIEFKGGCEYAPFDETKDPKEQLIKVAEKYKDKNVILTVRYFSEISDTWPEIYGYYPQEKRFLKFT